jgi:hypothetical protein
MSETIQARRVPLRVLKRKRQEEARARIAKLLRRPIADKMSLTEKSFIVNMSKLRKRFDETQLVSIRRIAHRHSVVIEQNHE